MIDRIRVVSLDRTPDRFAQFIERHPNLPVERFPAVDGALQDRAACVREGILAEDNIYVPGAIGCAMSHANLWRQCAAGSEAFHVAEDDAVLRHDFSSMASRLLGTLLDWDIVLWTNNLDWPLQLRPGDGLGVVVVQYDPQAIADAVGLEQFRSATAAPMLMPLISATGTCCYSVSPHGAARMLADCLPIGAKMPRYLSKLNVGLSNTGIDIEMCRHYAGWRAYAAMPPLAVPLNDQAASTIRGHLAAMHSPGATA